MAGDHAARGDRQARTGRRSDVEGGIGLPDLDPPAALRARPGRGQITLDWERVDGAAGYLIERAAVPDGPWEMRT